MITTKTRACVVIGNPVEHSLSPQIHNAAFNALSLDYIYVASAVKNLKEALHGIKALGYIGASVTIPHKEATLQIVDKVDEEAAAIGAINCVVVKNEELIGYNTDGRGWIKSFINGTKTTVENKTFVVIGAGGAARAIIVSLANSGVKKIIIANRTIERGVALAKHATKVSGTPVSAIDLTDESLQKALEEADVVVNGTSVGMHPNIDHVPFNTKLLKKNHIVCDAIFNPTPTRLLREAQQIGCTTLSGVGMLIEQGAIAFELWTGHQAPKYVMYNALKRNLVLPENLYD
ncbi:MAG: shikimate dehydrogenase [Syntrophomonadaceae bacterium]